jgi:hypothetical protein
MLDDLDRKFIGYLREGELDRATVAELREYLTARNLPSKGNKNFLLELVAEHLESLGYS